MYKASGSQLLKLTPTSFFAVLFGPKDEPGHRVPGVSSTKFQIDVDDCKAANDIWTPCLTSVDDFRIAMIVVNTVRITSLS